MNTGAPLSFAQEQLWFVDQIRAGAAEYMSYRAFRLRGEIDAGVLRAALEEIARRHEVLRTRYESVDGTALQAVDDPGAVDFTVLHDAGINAGEIGRSVVCAPFDLRTRPPWRVVLARRAPADADLLIAVHHIAFDGWSWRLLVQELGILYEAFAQGRPSPLPELELQYADFADRQREAWEHAEHAEELDWWRRRLAGLEPLELPTDRRRPAVWDTSADVAEFSVPAGVAASVCAVAAAAEATPFMAYLAAFQVLLARYARRTDIAVGVSVSGREQFGLEDLIGLFVNTVVLRTDLSGAPTFAEMLARARDTALDAFDHQDVPFDRVAAALAPEPDLSRNPVFQAGFALLTEQVFGTLTLPGVEAEPMPARALGATFDLSLIMTQRADGTVAGRLCYPTALFDPATMDRMVEALQQLLAGLAAAPHQPVHAVDLLGDADRARLAEWNNTALPTTESSLPELFAAAALSAAVAVAVVAGPAELTYAELADRVDRLAHHLRRLGVVAGTPVGVALPRGADLVTAVLAVLTAGAVYVPLPAEQPPSRLAAMVADAGVRLAVTDAQSRGLLPDRVEAVFAGGVSAEQPERAEARPAISAETAAYISFTSGSTGRPKGVVITHAGVRNRVLWAVDHLGLGPGERVLQRTTIGFDASLWEFLAPLVSGATVVMAPPQAQPDPAVIVQAVADHSISVLQAVPSVLRMLADEPGIGHRCASLRVVCSAGEALPAELCERLLDRLGADRVRILNTYGPTEYSIDATAWCYRPGQDAGTVPIGRPLPNTEVFVVDEHDRLVPCGAPGELCLTGVGLALGYLGRGDLTAERFTPNPHADEPGSRWYRTGDLVRWRGTGDTGALEFLGRVDRQVKVRGVRVEPGEVEAALLTHPSVASAAVLSRRDRGQAELVGYVVPAAGRTVDPDRLRDHVAGLLPPAMVPTALVAMPALPLTANGKLDHAALPAPAAAVGPALDTRPGDAAPTHTEPTETEPTETEPTETERTVAGFMAELLGVPRVRADEDFFALGGHSLLAVRLVLRLRRTFDVDLAADQVFHRRTARALAAVLDSALGPASRDAIRPVGRGSGLPLSFGQQRMWFVDRLEPGGAEYLIPLALRLRGPWSPEVLRRTVDDVAARHEILRTRYTEDFAQVIDPPRPARLAGLLRDAFGVDIPLRLLFENTTIAEAATAITDLLRAQIAELPAQEAGALTARGRRS